MLDDEPRNGPWRRYRRLQRDPIYDGVLTGFGLAVIPTWWHPFHSAAVNLAVALALPVFFGLVGWLNKRAARRAVGREPAR